MKKQEGRLSKQSRKAGNRKLWQRGIQYEEILSWHSRKFFKSYVIIFPAVLIVSAVFAFIYTKFFSAMQKKFLGGK